MPRMSLEDGIRLACEVHRGQVDLAGAPYILHPLRVMCQMRTEAEQLAAVLHDVVEDTEVTLEELALRGCPEDVLLAVAVLTHQPGESYTEYLERVVRCPLARRVKLKDLEDNMNLERLPEWHQKDLERFAKYQRAWVRLKKR